jgi:hypothetical protein
VFDHESCIHCDRAEKSEFEFVHADPSEGILNNPHMYTDGWKKQLTFVFAHKSHSVEDRSVNPQMQIKSTKFQFKVKRTYP